MLTMPTKEKLMEKFTKKKSVLIIYHNSCMDGLGAAAITAMHYQEKYEDKVEISTMAAHYPRDHGITMTRDEEGNKVDLLHAIRETDAFDIIAVVDFSVSIPQIMELSQLAKEKLIILDHHNAYKMEDLEEYANEHFGAGTDLIADHHIVLNSDRAGTGMVLDYFWGEEPQKDSDCRLNPIIERNMRYFGNRISERDIWNREDKEAFAFHEGICPDAFAFPDVDGKIVPLDLANSGGNPSDSTGGVAFLIRVFARPMLCDRYMATGFDVISYRDSIIKSIVEGQALFCEPNSLVNVKHIVVPCPYVLSSECGEYLRENYPDYHAYFMIRGQGLSGRASCSVRSRMPEFNAKEFAISQGGNGHPAAAGCSLKSYQVEYHYGSMARKEGKIMYHSDLVRQQEQEAFEKRGESVNGE